MHRAHKIRLNPTPEQEGYLRRATGTQRFVFNWGLAQIKDALDAGEKPPHVLELKKTFNAIKGEHFPWVYDVTKCAVEGGFQNLQAAMSNFFRSKTGQRKGKKMGFPHWKSRKRGYGTLALANDKVSYARHTVTIPRLGKVNMTEAVRFEGKFLKATVSFHAGWWISFAFDVAHAVPKHNGHPIGVDVGVKDLAVDSDGQRYENQAPLRRRLRQVRRACRTVSRRMHGSANRRKAVRKLAKLHYRIRCQRLDALHQATTEVVQRASVLGIEDLHVAGVMRNRRVARSLSDAAMSAFHRQLTYKAAWHGGVVQRIDRFFPSSQRHHGCGGRKMDLTLAARQWVCPACDTLVDRDLNAARNIRDEALRMVQSVA